MGVKHPVQTPLMSAGLRAVCPGQTTLRRMLHGVPCLDG